jgi:hypothetical protein
MTTELKAEGLEVVDPYADTVRVRVLPEPVLQQHPGSAAPVRGFDPYSTGIGALTVRPKPRRTLDDMRRLSEAIVRNRLVSKMHLP